MAHTLALVSRDLTVKARDIRKQKLVPVEIYGHGLPNIHAAVHEVAFEKVLAKAGRTDLIAVTLDGKTYNVIVQAIQYHPVRDTFVHVDMYQVNMKEEIEVQVAIRTEGVSPAVRDNGCMLLHPVDTVTVKCMPANIPHDLAVDISVLENDHDHITAGQIVMPKGVVLVSDADLVVISVSLPRGAAVEEESAPAADAPAEAPAAA